MSSKNLPMPIMTKATIALLFWILLYFFLTTFRNFLYPICLAILFAFLLYPLARFFEKRKVPRILANILTIIIGLLVVYGVLFFIYRQMLVFLGDLPTLKTQAYSNIEMIITSVESMFGITAPPEELYEEVLTRFFEQSSANIAVMLAATTNTLFTFFIMPVYVFFFLYYRDKFSAFILQLVPDTQHLLAEDTITKVSSITKKYMSGVFLVVCILCILNSVGFMIVGLKYAVLLGVIAAILNFIPYFGTILGYSVPLLVALLTTDSPKYALGVVIQFIIIQFTENNILTPNIVGGQTNINPFFIILGVLLGGVIWGLPGMFIVIPVIGMIKIACESIPRMQPLAFLIGNTGTEEHAITITKVQRFFGIKK
ncbi:AI-2E family transporter [Flammeovirgaceae bacterium SG7u.111]|nr:AI-2E family transporter [Flammeovirgaceae bacterium SG7u.132]WPO36993.1 AI-2E family transporter [Flammeovirgaceae bacterium SG7u.111]